MKKTNIIIKIGNSEDLIDLNLCANDFLDFLDDFKEKFKKKKYFILTAYYNSVLAGLLVSEDKSKIIDSLYKIIPFFYIHLIYVNPVYRNKGIGKNLLETFIIFQKKHGIASLYVKLPHKYKIGIEFFLKNDFHSKYKVENKIVLEYNLWKDYGITDDLFIADKNGDIFG